MKREFANVLKKVCYDLAHTYYVNFGGCTFMAGVILKNCEKYNITNTIKIYTRNGDINNWKHVSIMVSGIESNRDGYRNKKYIKIKQNYKWFNDFFNNFEMNRAYDTNNNIIVENKINELFDKWFSKMV